MIKIEIENRGGNVIYSHDCENNTLRLTLEKAVSEKVGLRGANLRGADLRDANLWGADLEGAHLGGATLGGADFTGACIENATGLPIGLEVK